MSKSVSLLPKVVLFFLRKYMVNLALCFLFILPYGQNIRPCGFYLFGLPVSAFRPCLDLRVSINADFRHLIFTISLYNNCLTGTFNQKPCLKSKQRQKKFVSLCPEVLKIVGDQFVHTHWGSEQRASEQQRRFE